MEPIQIWEIDMLKADGFLTEKRIYYAHKCKTDSDLTDNNYRKNARVVELFEPIPKSSIILSREGFFWYIKVGDLYWDWWESLIHKDSFGKPFGFKWTDIQVINHYKDIMYG